MHVLSRISALIAGQKKWSVITSLLLKDQAAVITWFSLVLYERKTYFILMKGVFLCQNIDLLNMSYIGPDFWKGYEQK